MLYYVAGADTDGRRDYRPSDDKNLSPLRALAQIYGLTPTRLARVMGKWERGGPAARQAAWAAALQPEWLVQPEAAVAEGDHGMDYAVDPIAGVKNPAWAPMPATYRAVATALSHEPLQMTPSHLQRAIEAITPALYGGDGYTKGYSQRDEARAFMRLVGGDLEQTTVLEAHRILRLKGQLDPQRRPDGKPEETLACGCVWYPQDQPWRQVASCRQHGSTQSG